MLVSTGELAAMLGGPDIIIVDARSHADYTRGHIPGAVHLDLFAFHWLDTSERGLGCFEAQSRTLLSMLGAAPGKLLVFYDSISGMLAARGVWMSMYMSHDSVAMLDGGITKWQGEGRPLETQSNGFRPSKFSGRADHSLVAGFERVRDGLQNVTIIDARSPGEYAGDAVRAARAGHIPGSTNVDWNANLNVDGTLKETNDLSKVYGMPRDAPVITYCHGAYRAANTFLALKLLGFEDVRVYLGSWGEWGNRLDLPVEL